MVQTADVRPFSPPGHPTVPHELFSLTLHLTRRFDLWIQKPTTSRLLRAVALGPACHPAPGPQQRPTRLSLLHPPSPCPCPAYSQHSGHRDPSRTQLWPCSQLPVAPHFTRREIQCLPSSHAPPPALSSPSPGLAGSHIPSQGPRPSGPLHQLLSVLLPQPLPTGSAHVPLPERPSCKSPPHPHRYSLPNPVLAF